MAAISLRVFIQAASIYAQTEGVRVLDVCRGVLASKFRAAVVNGRTVLSATDEGSGTTWSLPDGLKESDVLELAGRAVEWIESRPNPASPGLPRRITRLRVTFDRASL